MQPTTFFKNIRCLLSAALVSTALVIPADARPKSDLMCPANYQPVSAIMQDGTCQTFTNACEAMKAGAQIVPPGTCGLHTPQKDTSNTR